MKEAICITNYGIAKLRMGDAEIAEPSSPRKRFPFNAAGIISSQFTDEQRRRVGYKSGNLTPVNKPDITVCGELAYH